MSDAIPGQPEPSATDSALRPVSSSLSFPVVGIGASAGGVRALLEFFENAPTDMGMAFVVVLHLSPDHVSSADAVLSRVTGMPVLQVVQPVLIEKNRVYVVAPGKSLAMTDGYLRVGDAKRSLGSPVTIDRFFRSLADAHGPHAMCLVLSGSGSDGAVGLSRIKEQGGITLAQLPSDAEYAQMPQSAIDTGQVDLVLPVTEMPQKLLELWSNARTISIPEIGKPDSSSSATTPVRPEAPTSPEDSRTVEQCLQEILSILRARTGHDFRHYKRATMLRRIERRLQVNAVPDLSLYRDLLRRRPAETSALLSDMLIGVTNFFRDREAFEQLQSEVVPELFSGKSDGQAARVWTAGVSSGEEAYSIAMLLERHAQLHHLAAAIQVFATDIDEQALGRARAGNYPDSIATDVPAELLQQFLTKQGERYVIAKSLREKVLFAVHNVLRDPPFSHLDLVSCRNLLIYLDRSVQRQVLEMFHFALCPDGYLFLGTSESADAADDLFAVVDKKNRIYRAKPVAVAVRPRIMRLVEPKPIASALGPQRPEPMQHELSPGALHQRVLEEYAPPSIIVDRESTIVHMSDNAGRFLHYSGGIPTTNVIAAALPDLRLDLRTALFKASQSGRSVEARRVSLVRGGQRSYVHITVRPFHDVTVNGEFALILFDEVQETLDDADGAGANQEDASIAAQLEQELQRSKLQLSETVEQYETTLEEMKAGNEELQAINEELRSTTDELESSKEELQSINEELITVNSELQMRIEDASKANDDLQNFISASDIATLFVDKAMMIKRFTSNATGLFNLIPSDVGRSLTDITHRLRYDSLAADVAETLRTLATLEREVESTDERWLLLRVRPYRTADDRIEGVVITLIDITARRRAEQRVNEGEQRLRLAAQSTKDYAIIVQDNDGIIQSWNRGAQRLYGYTEAEVLGKNIDIIYTPEDKACAVRERELASGDTSADDERWHIGKDGRKVYMSGVVTRIEDPSFSGYAKIGRDLTDRKRREEATHLKLRLAQTVRERAVSSNRLKDRFLAILSHELKHPLNLIHVKAEMLPRIPRARDIPEVREAAEAITRAAVSQAKIIDDLLDLSRIRTGKLALHTTKTDAARVLARIVEACTADAHSRGIALSCSGLEEPIYVLADPIRLDQVIWNLVSNALKFTPSGGKVAIALKEDGPGLRIDVVDTGDGIDGDLLPHVFDMFRQGTAEARRVKGGLGIGLALVKQLVEMHGGKVSAHSDGRGHGTRFSLWFPRCSVTATPEPLMASPEAGLRHMRILVVDDDTETANAFGMLLESEGAVVTTAYNAEEALAELRKASFDLLISDVGMAAMDGYEFIAAVRQMPGRSSLPAIALTGYSTRDEHEAALSAGFNAHLSKPVSLEALYEQIKVVNPFNGSQKPRSTGES